MGSDVLAKYYEGILNQIRGEVDFINEVFAHQGLKGEGNETVIRNLLKKFIPHKYGVGSGIVIDRHGTPSKQCDIVIYDNYNYPEILSLSSIHIYPVDLVYATIEIKTTLDASKAKQAVENIESVRRLDFIKDDFRVYPTEAAFEMNMETEWWDNVATEPPIGFIFGYRSNTSNYVTFANWFKKSIEQDERYWPSYIFCLDQGMIIGPGSDNRNCSTAQFCIENIRATEIRKYAKKEWYEYQGHLYPLSKVGNKKFVIDQSKILLYFVVLLSELLKQRLLSPHINFRKQYFTEELLTLTRIENI